MPTAFDDTPAPRPADRDIDRLRENVHTLEAEYGELLAGSGVLQEDRDATRILLEAARHSLDAAERALDRAADGSYGLCQRCGGAIGAERLEALPDVTTCIDCQGRHG
jgi:RNA polymerase-binding transcription factor DksA